MYIICGLNSSPVCRCIPFRYRYSEENDGKISEKNVDVLMITSTSGPGLLFPKVCIRVINYDLKICFYGFVNYITMDTFSIDFFFMNAIY